jgi:hypothetical protein
MLGAEFNVSEDMVFLTKVAVVIAIIFTLILHVI